MPRLSPAVLAASVAVLAAACAEGITSSNFDTSDLAGAFNSTLLGFTYTTNSFNASSDSSGSAYRPEGGEHGRTPRPPWRA